MNIFKELEIELMDLPVEKKELLKNEMKQNKKKNLESRIYDKLKPAYLLLFVQILYLPIGILALLNNGNDNKIVVIFLLMISIINVFLILFKKNKIAYVIFAVFFIFKFFIRWENEY